MVLSHRTTARAEELRRSVSKHVWFFNGLLTRTESSASPRQRDFDGRLDRGRRLDALEVLPSVTGDVNPRKFGGGGGVGSRASG
jgi:hypothetical protein